MNGGMRASDRELHALVRADRTAEDDSLRRIAGGLVDEPAAVADAFCGDQDPLGVHAVEDLPEAAPFGTDERIGGELDAVEEHLGRRVVQHRLDRADRRVRPPVASRRSTRNVDNPCVRFSTWSSGVVRASSSIRSEWSARDVQIFWPCTTYPSSFALGGRLDVRRVAAGGRLGHTERLKPERPSAICGSQRSFCSVEPCRRIVPIVYICA